MLGAVALNIGAVARLSFAEERGLVLTLFVCMGWVRAYHSD